LRPTPPAAALGSAASREEARAECRHATLARWAQTWCVLRVRAGARSTHARTHARGTRADAHIGGAVCNCAASVLTSRGRIIRPSSAKVRALPTSACAAARQLRRGFTWLYQAPQTAPARAARGHTKSARQRASGQPVVRAGEPTRAPPCAPPTPTSAANTRRSYVQAGFRKWCSWSYLPRGCHQVRTRSARPEGREPAPANHTGLRVSTLRPRALPPARLCVRASAPPRAAACLAAPRGAARGKLRARAAAAASQGKRVGEGCARGARTDSICCPHPAQVILPQVPHFTARHMLLGGELGVQHGGREGARRSAWWSAKIN
jgi:hypothetical protein